MLSLSLPVASQLSQKNGESRRTSRSQGSSIRRQVRTDRRFETSQQPGAAEQLDRIVDPARRLLLQMFAIIPDQRAHLLGHENHINELVGNIGRVPDHRQQP